MCETDNAGPGVHLLKRLRCLRSSPGRCQTVPHAHSVMSSWPGRVKGVALLSAFSTYSLPRTSLRTLMPSSKSLRCSSSFVASDDMAVQMSARVKRENVDICWALLVNRLAPERILFESENLCGQEYRICPECWRQKRLFNLHPGNQEKRFARLEPPSRQLVQSTYELATNPPCLAGQEPCLATRVLGCMRGTGLKPGTGDTAPARTAFRKLNMAPSKRAPTWSLWDAAGRCEPLYPLCPNIHAIPGVGGMGMGMG